MQPANVLIDAAGHACLSDLGLSAFASNATLRVALGVKLRAAAKSETAELPDLRKCAVEVNGCVIRPYLRGKAGTPGYWAPGKNGYNRYSCDATVR